MGQRGLVVLLLSGLVFPCGGLNRHFHYAAQQLNWTEAQRFCRESFTDLATLDGPDQQAEARKVVPNGMFWIGLSDGNWMWTQSGQELSESSSFVSWAEGQPGIGQCAVISANGLWAARSCTEKQQVVCYTGSEKNYTLVEKLMDWPEAQHFCRTHYKDLGSISNQQENNHVSGLLKDRTEGNASPAGAHNSDESDERLSVSSDNAGNVHAWIDLRRKSWSWSDQSSTSYWQWADMQPEGPAAHRRCVLMKIHDEDPQMAAWYTKPCTEAHQFICYSVPRVTVMRVRVRLTGRPADLDDAQTADGLLQQLQRRLEEHGLQGATLSWSIQPHRGEEEEEEERSVC